MWKHSVTYALVTLWIHSMHSLPLQSCESQFPCLDVTHSLRSDTDSEGKPQYEMCLFWKKSEECTVHEIISYMNHHDVTRCNVVSCDDIAPFSARINDDSQCDGIAVQFDFLGAYAPENEQKITCIDGDDDGTGACQWNVPAPICETNYLPTTSEPGTDDDKRAVDEVGFVTSITLMAKFLWFCTLLILLVIGSGLVLFVSGVVLCAVCYAKRINKIAKNSDVYHDVETEIDEFEEDESVIQVDAEREELTFELDGSSEFTIV